MKGDFTRSTFKREEHYSSVRWQQGRVHLDADWNEQMDILAHRGRTTHGDVIGRCGGPAGDGPDGEPLAGFRVDVDPADPSQLTVSPGRFYVDGILVENEALVSLAQQPDLPPLPGNSLADVLVPPGSELSPGTYLAFLDVWERHITALEDPAIREVALGGPDTATRTRVVWQVKLMAAAPQGDAEEDVETPLNCASELAGWEAATGASTGRMMARAEPTEETSGPCLVPAQAGYRGLENQLYRVEVHRVISEDEITVKWSRENGSVVTAWLGQDPPPNANRITVQSSGRDQVLGFAADDWVELTDDVRELRGQPGLLVQVQSVEGNVLVLDPAVSVDRADFPVNPKVRRWDMPSDVGEIHVDLTAPDVWIELEDGVQVQFQAGRYRTGDYWTIPARTATRDIEWPQDGSDPPQPLALPPQGIQHHHCRLALLSFDGEAWSVLSDCRPLFPPLTEQIRFFLVGGDGQEAMPRQFLPQPLQVGVSNGQWPVAGARVAFEILVGNGRLRAPGMGLAKRLVVETDAQGVAQCEWRLDAPNPSQRVQATLLELDGRPFVDEDGAPRIAPLFFNANQSRADQVAYDPRRCPDLKEATTVQAAIDILCRRPQGGGCCVTVGEGGAFPRLDQAISALLEEGRREICICLLAGEHETVSPSITRGLAGRDLHITIHGCGPASRLTLADKPWLFQGVAAVTLRDLVIEPAFQVNNVAGAISFRHCAQVTVTGCTIRGFTPEGPLLTVADADQVRLRDNLLEASQFTSLEIPQKLFTQAEVGPLADLFALPGQGEFHWATFREKATEAANALAGMNSEERKAVQQRIQQAFGDQELRRAMSSGEVLNLFKLAASLGAEKVDPVNMLDLLLDIRRAAIKARPGLALVLGETFPPQQLPQVELGILDEDDLISLESNEIAGVVSLYGLPAAPDFLRKVLTPGFLKTLQGQLAERRVVLNGLLGTLNLRGNQLVQVTVAREVIQALQQALSSDNVVQLFGLFGRLLASDNVFEAGESLVVVRHLAMMANDFKMTAGVQPPPGATAPPAQIAGVVIADTSIYTGNHGRGGNLRLQDVSRASERVANLELELL